MTNAQRALIGETLTALALTISDDNDITHAVLILRDAEGVVSLTSNSTPDDAMDPDALRAFLRHVADHTLPENVAAIREFP